MCTCLSVHAHVVGQGHVLLHMHTCCVSTRTCSHQHVHTHARPHISSHTCTAGALSALDDTYSLSTHTYKSTCTHTHMPTRLLTHLYGWGALCSIRCRRRPPPWSRIRTPRRQQLLLLLLLLLSAPARHLSSACKTDHKSEHTTVSAADEGEVHTQNSLLLLLLRRSFYICPCVITSCVLAFARYPPVFAFADASLCLTLLEDLLCLLLLGAPLCWCTQPR